MNDMDRLRERLSSGKPKGKSFEPPGINDFTVDYCVLAFDPTLTNCGWVELELIRLQGQEDPVLKIWDKGIIRPHTYLTGFVSTWEKSRQLNEQLSGLILRKSVSSARIICETPWVGSGGHRTESALIAGTLVYLYAGLLFVPVSAQHAYAVLCGGRRPPTSQAKKDIALSVARYIPESAGRDWNEHQRDAAALALTFLYDLKKESHGNIRRPAQAGRARPEGEREAARSEHGGADGS